MYALHFSSCHGRYWQFESNAIHICGEGVANLTGLIMILIEVVGGEEGRRRVVEILRFWRRRYCANAIGPGPSSGGGRAFHHAITTRPTPTMIYCPITGLTIAGYILHVSSILELYCTTRYTYLCLKEYPTWQGDETGGGDMGHIGFRLFHLSRFHTTTGQLFCKGKSVAPCNTQPCTGSIGRQIIWLRIIRHLPTTSPSPLSRCPLSFFQDIVLKTKSQVD